MAEHQPVSVASTSLSLLERAQSADPRAWQQIVQIYGPLVFFWTRKSGLEAEDAADVVQEVWKAVHHKIEGFHRGESTGAFRRWLWTITRNKACDHFRERHGEARAAGGTDARQFLETVPEEEPPDATGVQEHGLLHRALEVIRPEYEERTWKAFWRMTVDGVPAPEVAAELGMAANAVHQAKFRIVRRLREELGELIEAPV
jgi:RNA polymerase sigma-70 factor (ECF subfamily)